MDNTSKMQVRVTFKGMESSDALKEYAEKRASKLIKHMHHLTHCDFVLFVEKTEQVAQAHIISGDFEARAESRAETVYAAIDEVTDKLLHQSSKHKEKKTAHRGSGHHNQGG